MKRLACISLAAALFAVALPAGADIPPRKKSKCAIADTREARSSALEGWASAAGAGAVAALIARRRARGSRR